MAINLSGKAIVITGAGRGIGAAAARAAGALGARLILNDLDATEVEAVAVSIRQQGGQAVSYPADITSWEAAERLIRCCVDNFGVIDGLVNNAALLRLARIDEINESMVRDLVGANILGTIFCAVHAARHMIPRRCGSIVNVSSGAQCGMETFSVYGATKAASASLVYAWAMELAANQIRVNAVSPMARTRMDNVTQVYRAERSQPPLDAALPDPALIAPLFLYLLSDASQALTGQVVRFDGNLLSLMTHPSIYQPSQERSSWSVESIEEAFRSDLLNRQLPTGMTMTTGAFKSV